MASIETLMDQVSKSDLDIAALVRLRGAVDAKLLAASAELDRQKATIERALDSRRHRAAPSSGGGRRGRNASHSAGRHSGMSVAESLRKVIGKGGKMSAAQIKSAFDEAGDNRILNFTILTRSGVVKRVGLEKKEEGRKGRAGGIYAVA
jgi:hypothetical protein